MKTIFPLSILVLTIAALPIAAQTANPAASSPAKKTATSTPAAAATQPARGCVKLPTLSPKVPALPAGLSCAKPLYTITTNPPAKLTDISPMEDPGLRDALGIPLPITITLSYIDTKVGSGALLAPRKWYTIHYTGYLVDGAKFDSSFDHPDHAPLIFQQGTDAQGRRQVVPGMDTGLDGMRVGGKRRIFIPYQLGYGPTNYPPPPRPTTIPGKSWLIFDIDLVSQSDNDPRTLPTSSTPAPAAAAKPAAAPPAPATAPTPAASPAPAATAPKPATAPALATAPAQTTTPQPAAPKP